VCPAALENSLRFALELLMATPGSFASFVRGLESSMFEMLSAVEDDGVLPISLAGDETAME